MRKQDDHTHFDRFHEQIWCTRKLSVFTAQFNSPHFVLASMTDALSSLGTDVLFKIFSYVTTVEDRLACALTCKLFWKHTPMELIKLRIYKPTGALEPVVVRLNAYTTLEHMTTLFFKESLSNEQKLRLHILAELKTRIGPLALQDRSRSLKSYNITEDSKIYFLLYTAGCCAHKENKSTG